jgi:DNA-binding MarR family transcriptional regulator
MPSSEQCAIRAWQHFIWAKAATRRVVHKELRERGLTGSQFAMLWLVAESGTQGLKLNEISQGLHVTCGNITGMVDRLEEAGLLSRLPHAEDRRITLAVLTAQGRETVEQISPTYHSRIERLMSVLTEQEQTLLAELLGRLAKQAAVME